MIFEVVKSGFIRELELQEQGLSSDEEEWECTDNRPSHSSVFVIDINTGKLVAKGVCHDESK